ncbi:hypothetical protein PAHAL_2G013200 [Panicum hallii]|uniref:F-box domain-containing protein n=1 Tax=Panicum hallii TaxID=206008 RepID=A0A2S3GV80_9POAL|nr:hypothetical protein PAHAL_2G013200 [Panicum hallii]
MCSATASRTPHKEGCRLPLGPTTIAAAFHRPRPIPKSSRRRGASLRVRPSKQHGEGADGLGELVEEILLRLPPDDPASLVRATTMCSRWCRVVSAPGFRRGFAERHRAAPMLGFFANLRDGDEDDFVARLVPATPFRPRHADRRGTRALNARHGCVLLTTTPWEPNLEVWDPVTGELRELPRPNLPYSLFRWNAAVVCAAHGECDHLDCRGGPFGGDAGVSLPIRGWRLERADLRPSLLNIWGRDGSYCPCGECALFPDGCDQQHSTVRFGQAERVYASPALWFRIGLHGAHDVGGWRVGIRKCGEVQTLALVNGDRS